ncbi:hypothetical protein HZS_1896 [Henneguya salminicola]|nr:hypothetical protein HZS_1896 [Henneguya salminicola]
MVISNSIERSLDVFNNFELGFEIPFDCNMIVLRGQEFNLRQAVDRCWRAAIDVCWRNVHIRENEKYSSNFIEYLASINEKKTQDCNKCLELAYGEIKTNCKHIFSVYHLYQSLFLLRLFFYS